jgi:two-component system chemotaxis sensor kinase CheA
MLAVKGGAVANLVDVHVIFVGVATLCCGFVARGLFAQLASLEAEANVRTAQVSDENKQLQALLDNAAQGLAKVDRSGTLGAHRSKAFVSWFGSEHDMFAAFGARSPAFATELRQAWNLLNDGGLPRAVLLEQLPQRLDAGSMHFSIEYCDVSGSDDILLVVSDVSEQAKRERDDRERLEFVGLLKQATTDGAIVQGLLEEGADLIDTILSVDSDDTLRMRALHTLKGNSALFGLSSVAELCHALEAECRGEMRVSFVNLAALQQRWGELSAQLGAIVRRRPSAIEVTDVAWAQLQADAEVLAPSLAGALAALTLEPSHGRLSLFADEARRIALTQGKQLCVQVRDHGVRLEPRVWGALWQALVHPVRNAVDHGIEAPEVRVANGKAKEGTLILETQLVDGMLTFRVSDDGAGIDWEALRERAALSGLPAQEHDDLVAALFAAGISTSATVGSISGRGVGLDALQAVTRALSGQIHFESHPGLGTTLRLSFPVATPSSIASCVDTKPAASLQPMPPTTVFVPAGSNERHALTPPAA